MRILRSHAMVIGSAFLLATLLLAGNAWAQTTAAAQAGVPPSAPPPAEATPAPDAPPADAPPAPPLPPPPPYAPPYPEAPLPPSPDADDGMQTLVSDDIEHGGWGGLSVMGGSVMGDDAVFVGARGGWLANHAFTLGGGGFGLASRIPAPPGAAPSDTGYDLTFGYGGLWLEYAILPRYLVHATVGALVGAGGVGVMRHQPTEYDHDNDNGDGVFVTEPTLSVELNLTHFMRLDLSASYRLVRGVELTGLDDADLSGFGFGGIVKFGKF